MKRMIWFIGGWIAFIIGFIGAFLPVLPTVPLMILAAACFARSSEKFHQMLLNNRWIGADIQRWEEQRTISAKAKRRALITIVISFTISIMILSGRPYLQIMLLTLMCVTMTLVYRLPEQQYHDK